MTINKFMSGLGGLVLASLLTIATLIVVGFVGFKISEGVAYLWVLTVIHPIPILICVAILIVFLVTGHQLNTTKEDYKRIEAREKTERGTPIVASITPLQFLRHPIKSITEPDRDKIQLAAKNIAEDAGCEISFANGGKSLETTLRNLK